MYCNKIKFNLKKEGKGIWTYAHLLVRVDENYRLTLGEGNTPEINSHNLGVIFKREDMNPTGSLKDRGMAFLLSQLYSKGLKQFVLPSSGNAAISACTYSNLVGLEMKIYVTPNIEPKKLEKLRELAKEVEITPKTLSNSANFAINFGYHNLRPSLNEDSSEGYKTIAFEIAENQGIIGDIFLPVSSGVCLLGIYEGFKTVGYMPKIHLCQTSKVHPLAVDYDKNFTIEDESLAKAIVAKSVPLKKEIINAVNQSQGRGWVIENKQIIEAQEILINEGIETSNEGVLAFAAIQKAKGNGYVLGKTVCLLTGRKYN